MQKLSQWLGVRPEKRSLLVTIYLAFFNSGMMAILLGALLPQLREAYGLSYVQSGLMLSANQIGNFFAVILAGILPYVLGRKQSTLLMGSGIVTGLVLMTLTGSPLALVVAFTLMGISRGTMSNICNVVVSDAVSNKTAGLNILHASFAVGALTAPILMVALPRVLPWGWRCAPWAVVLCALAVFVRIGGSGLSGQPTPKPAGGETGFWRDSGFWINAGILFFYLCAETSIIGWFVTYFRDTGLLTATLADMTPTLLWVMILAGRLGCASLASRVDKNKLLIGLSAMFAVFFAVLLTARSAAVCIGSLLLIGLCMAGIYPTTLASTKNTSSTIVTGAIISIASIGGIVMPGIVGAIAEVRGVAGGVAAILAAILCMVALVLVKFFTERAPAPQSQLAACCGGDAPSEK